MSTEKKKTPDPRPSEAAPHTPPPGFLGERPLRQAHADPVVHPGTPGPTGPMMVPPGPTGPPPQFPAAHRPALGEAPRPLSEPQPSAPAMPQEGTPEFNALPAAIRTQIIADNRYRGSNRYFLTLRDQPSITLAANSPEEAQARYLQLCGVTHTENPVGVRPAD